jgi:putative nucleotidyltransferase with HDIG domain
MFIAINSVFILFTYPLILLFEKLFKITTDFTLLELADTNLPLMKELMGKAPGTFHHSLQVANLADSAASEIGANALECRVGAMFHDIGKMVKPSYFIENQNKTNEHEKLKPRMSTLVIKAHVSEGVKIAEEHNLPKVIIEFIKTHHGTSLIKYFHKKAADEEQDIQDEDFRYDGPIPYTKEQGILLLADSVEAACRSMKEPTYKKLENQINRVVEDHINDGQLSNCPLTFRQIQIIKDSFLSILKGVYHTRIEDPGDEEDKQKEKAPKNEPQNQPEPTETPDQ